jgi:hypothetical protein
VTTVWAGCALGALLGARHATEPDHLAAIAALVTRVRSPWRGAVLGAFWGLGHMFALLAFGGALVALGRVLPPQAGQALEGMIGLLLIGLGAAALRQALATGGRGPLSPHAHAHGAHAHPTSGAHVHVGTLTLARRPLLVGFAHGLAGSGALSAAVLAELPSTPVRLLYMATFGLGSVLAMAVLSGGLGVPLSRALPRPRLHAALSAGAGLVSVGLGVFWSASAAWQLWPRS